MLNKLITRLKQYEISWQAFNPNGLDYEYNDFNTEINNFLKNKGYYINHSYCDNTLEMSYIIYDKGGNIVDINTVEYNYINPYHSAIESCFKLINNSV